MARLARSFLLLAVLCGGGGFAAGPRIASAQQTVFLDINTATPEQLAALPGMGAAYARRIVAGRPYSAKNLLLRRGVLPAPAYERIKDRIVAHRVRSTTKPGG